MNSTTCAAPSDAVGQIESPLPLDVDEVLAGPLQPLSVKRAFDFSAAALLFLTLLPLFIGVTLIVLVMQGRPVLIRHKRLGLHGRTFPCLKFRSMVTDADRALGLHLEANEQARVEWEASHKLRNDPRITPLGSILRKTSLDELPQLLNVLRGDMSLVGPRPIVQSEVRHYGEVIRKYYKVRPGVTGPWQASGRSDTSYATRVKLDEDYVDRQSFLGDISILAKTIPAVIRMSGSC